MSKFHEDWFNNLAINQDLAVRDVSLYTRLVTFATAMQPILNREPAYKPVAYTLHDFDHHIKNVLSNMSALLKDHIKSFSAEALFCLQCACIAHDIDMAYNPKGRNTHGYNGGAIINERFRYDAFATDDDLQEKLAAFEYAGTIGSDDASMFVEEIGTKLNGFVTFLMDDDAKYSETISWIVLGHSDIKLPDCTILTLEVKCYDDMQRILHDSAGKEFPLKVMAALLRWADELDCSQYRLKSPKEEPMNPESKKHWDMLRIFRNVDIDGPHVKLIIDDLFIQKDETHLFELLYERMEKLDKERNAVNRCFSSEHFSFSINDIGTKELEWKEERKEQYQQYIEQKKKDSQYLLKDFESDELVTEIREYVGGNDLYKEGHFILHDDVNGECKISVRNTFDCVGVLARHQFLDGISQALLNFLYNNSFAQGISELTDDSFFLIGIANSGALLAAHMSFLAGLPYTYLVPVQKKGQYTKWEQFIDDTKAAIGEKRVALVIGVNHTGSSIRDACRIIEDKLEKDKNEIHVVGFLNRESACGDTSSIVNILAREGIRSGFLMEEYANDRCVHSDEEVCPYDKICIQTGSVGGYI